MSSVAKRLRALSTLGRALRHRNDRVFFFDQGTSLVGTWLTRIATVCVVGGLSFFYILPELRRLVRPIYARLGIVPPLAAGVRSATQAAIPPES